MKRRANHLLPCSLAIALFCMSLLSVHADFSGIEIKINDAAGSARMQEVLSDANAYVRSVYGKTSPELAGSDYYPMQIEAGGIRHEANDSYYRRYGIIVYWSGSDLRQLNRGPQDVVKARSGDPFYRKGELIYRYLGFDQYGDKLYNPYFPPDKFEENPKYVIKPWKGKNNPIWLRILQDDEALKKHVMANFSKSLIEGMPKFLESYFRYRKPFSSKDLLDRYKKQYDSHLRRLFADPNAHAAKIKLISLPTSRVKGFAQYLNSNNYYDTVLLAYQDRLDARLEIRHLAVDWEGGKGPHFRVSDQFHPIHRENKSVLIRQGETKSFRAKESKAYRCLGHMIYPSERDAEAALGPAGKRSRISQVIASTEASYKHEYRPGNDRPVLVFFYEKVSDSASQLSEPAGGIVISSDSYEVSRAIPSEEAVKIAVHSDQRVLADYSIEAEESVEPISIYLRQRIEYEDEDGNIKRDYEESYLETVYKEYKVYKVHDCSVYHLKGADVRNPTLKRQGPIAFNARGIGPSRLRIYERNVRGIRLSAGLATYPLRQSYDREQDEFKVIIDVGEEDYLSDDEILTLLQQIEQGSELRVRNDFLMIDGQIVLSDALFDGVNPPAPIDCQKRPISLEIKDYKIPVLTPNGRGETTGNLFYEKRISLSDRAEDEKHFDLGGNPVLIHTPSANRTELRSDEAFDQRADARKIGLAAPLDHVMELDFLTEFQHIREKGYGYRDYRKHLQYKSLRAGFDAYVSTEKRDLEHSLPDKAHFVKAGKLLRFDPKVEKIYYKAAPWVKEGRYTIETFAVAKNALLRFDAERDVNLDFKHYAAFNRRELYVSGRLFDLRVDRVLDPAFSSEGTGAFYSLGTNNKEGLPGERFQGMSDAEKRALTLPVSAGKGRGKGEVKREVKAGYPILFSVKSMGTYFAEGDILSVKARFYHIDRAGNKHHRIALYAREKGELVRLDGQEGLTRSAVYFDLATASDLLEHARSAELLRKSGQKGEIVDYAKYRYKSSKPVFSYNPDILLLTYPFRTFVGPVTEIPDGVDSVAAAMSVQRWKGVYSLPASLQAFPLDDAGNPKLHEPIETGSIAIVFDIALSRDGNRSGPELSFVTDTSNEYLIEGYQSEQGGFSYENGTVLLYSLEQRADEDLLEK